MAEMTKSKDEWIVKVRDIKSDLILDAALKVFSSKGIVDTRLEDIAEAAGFSKASLYNYFDNKEMIVYSLVIREWEKVIELFNSSPDYGLRDDLPFDENIRRYFTLLLKAYGEHFYFVISVSSWEYTNILNRRLNDTMLDGLVSFKKYCADNSILKILDFAKRNDELRTDFSDVLIINFTDSVLFGAIHTWIIDDKVGDTEQTARDLCKFFMNGIKR